MVRPVHHAAFVVPFIFTLEGDPIADCQSVNSLRYIDVVCNQYRLPGRKCHDEPLMPAAIVVIGEYSRDGAGALGHKVPAVFRQSRCKDIVRYADRRGCAPPPTVSK